MKIHATITVSGLVQGVGYRYFTYKKANEYGLTGYVKNLPTGEVLCEVEGDEGLINEFIKDLRIGPVMARVRDVYVEKSNVLQGYRNFEITF